MSARAGFVRRHRALLVALGHRLSGTPGWLSADDEEQYLAVVGEAAAERPLALRLQLELFFFVIRWLPALLWLRPFDRLPPAHQDYLLRALQEAPVALVRKGFWGVRTMVYMGVYGRGVVR